MRHTYKNNGTNAHPNFFCNTSFICHFECPQSLYIHFLTHSVFVLMLVYSVEMTVTGCVEAPESATPDAVLLTRCRHHIAILNENIYFRFFVKHFLHTKKYKCDPTQVNKADVVRGPNCDLSVKVFCRNQESF